MFQSYKAEKLYEAIHRAKEFINKRIIWILYECEMHLVLISMKTRIEFKRTRPEQVWKLPHYSESLMHHFKWMEVSFIFYHKFIHFMYEW